MNDKVLVTSMVNHSVGISLPQNGYMVRKSWPQRGAKVLIDKESLREGIYNPGVESIFKEGILYIEDMDFKIELGLEEPETQTPTNIIPVDEKYLERVLKRMPVAEMKQVLKKMSAEQVQELILFASNQNDVQLDRVNAIKEITGTDLFKVIELKRQREE
jgi:hypothetical protein